MTTETTTTLRKCWTAGELRRLPSHQRDAILKAAAAQAEEEYRRNLDLTAFEAFGKDDLHVDSANAETR